MARAAGLKFFFTYHIWNSENKLLIGLQQEGHCESKKSVITRLHKRDKRYNNKESDCANRIRNQAVHHWTVFDWIILFHFPLCQINVQKIHQNTNYRVRGVKQTSVINNCIFVSFDVTVAIAGIRARNRLSEFASKATGFE